MHRDRFLPFIDYIENDCLVINIDSGKDYRKNRIIDAEIYYSPLNDLTEEAMDKIFNNITNGSPYEEKILFVKGREIRVERQALGCARFDFEELCVKPLGAEDYLAISKEFDIIFIEKIPILKNQRKLSLLVLFLFITVSILLFIIQPEPEANINKPIPVVVDTMKLQKKNISPIVEYTGRLEPSKKADLKFEINGRLAEKLVQPGEFVKSGDIILILEEYYIYKKLYELSKKNFETLNKNPLPQFCQT